jgi:hypothetical protein
MCRRYIRMLLLVVGSTMVFLAVFPVMAFLHFEDSLQITLIASKLLLLPLGAICLAGAAMLSKKAVYRRSA